MKRLNDRAPDRHRLLLIEDNPGDVELVREHLLDLRSDAGSLDVAATLAQGLERLEHGGYSSILLDLNLPDSTGLATVDRVVEWAASTPVIVLTGGGADEMGVNALGRGAADFLPKDELDGPLLSRSIRYAEERYRLKGVEARYRALVENSRDLVSILDPDLSLRYVSPSIHRILGFDPGENGKAHLEVHLEDRQHVEHELKRVLTDEDYVAHFQYRLRHRDGGWRIVDALAQNCLDDPHITGLVVSCRDVSDLRAAEEAAFDTARRLKQTLQAIEDAVFTIDVAHRITDCNPAAERMFGHPKRELTGRSTRILHVDERSFQRFGEASSPVLRQGRAFRSELSMCRRDGTTFPAGVTVTLLNPQKGVEGGVVSVIYDRTEHVDRERQVRFQAALLQQVGQPVIAADEGGRVTYWNEAAEDLTGWGAQEVIGRDVVEFLVAGDREVALAAREAARAGERWEGEIRWRKKDGSAAIVYITATPGVNPDGSIGGRIATAVDVTERRELEGKLRQAQKMEAVGRLAGGVAHDFNNLLTAIEGHVSILLEDVAPNSPHTADLEEIRKSGRRAADLTHQLLAFSRKQVLVERKVDLSGCVLDLKKMLERLVPAHIEFRMEGASVPLVVRADPTQLQQVVMNLVVNAVDAVKDGGAITVRTDVVELSQQQADAYTWAVDPGWYARLSVEDTGTGIAPEARDHLFEPFFTTKPEGRGTGLGLATVYGIVKQSGGHVLMESEPGRGTTFQIVLPRLGGDPDPVVERPHAPSAAEGAVILVVEDDDAVRRLARRVLERAGYTVLEATDGRQALELANEEVDLVVTDVVMPDLGGVQLQKRLVERYPDLKIIFTSGYSEADLRREIRGLGTTFVPKPFTPDQLVRAVGEALSQAERGPSDRTASPVTSDPIS